MTQDLLAAPVLLRIDKDTHVCRITLNRPRSLNAINVSLLNSLVDALHTVNASDTKVCVIDGSGTSFCSGEDLKETLAPKSKGQDTDELRRALEMLQDVTRLMTKSGIVFIAAVRGWAVGGGAEIALATDIVIVGPDTTFRFPEIIHAHAPTGGITGRLPQLIGLQPAKRLLLLGEDVSATKALSLNLVAEVVDDPLARSLVLAEQLSSRSAKSLAAIKRTIESSTFPLLEQSLNAEMDAASLCFADHESTHAYAKFQARKQDVSAAVRTTLQDTVPVNSPESIQTLLDALQQTAASRPDAVFLRFGTVDTTYSQFLLDVTLQADGFLEAGIVEGDVIAAMMTNCEEMARLWFASMWVGAIWAPLHTEFRGLVLERALALVSPKIMICDDVFIDYQPPAFNHPLYIRGEVREAHSPLSSLSGFKAVPACQIEPNTTSSLLFTSGTTGPSKACALSHSYFISTARSLCEPLALRSDDILFCPFPLCHADATSLTVIPALLMGATAAISKRFSASRWWDEIRETRSSVADFMGATLSILFKAPPLPTDSDNPLRIMWGVPVPTWVEDFEKRFDLKVYEVYGSTETGLPVVQRIDQPRVEGSCGVPLRNVGLRIVDENGKDVRRGATGELLVFRSPDERFTCYFRNESATDKAIQNGWFHTGDYCRLDEEDNLFFIGRKKHVIRRRGENISAFEIEESLLKHAGIRECAAFGVPSQLTEEDLKVSIVRSPGSTMTEEDVHDFAVKTMARFQVPRYIEFVSELPRTPTGKLEVFKLQDHWAEGHRESTKDFESRKHMLT